MKLKIIIFSVALLAAFGAVALVVGPNEADAITEAGPAPEEQVVAKTKGVVLLDGDKPVEYVSVDSLESKKSGKNKQQLASNDTSIQLWIE